MSKLLMTYREKSNYILSSHHLIKKLVSRQNKKKMGLMNFKKLIQK